jgi:hypothetical protein
VFRDSTYGDGLLRVTMVSQLDDNDLIPSTSRPAKGQE